MLQKQPGALGVLYIPCTISAEVEARGRQPEENQPVKISEWAASPHSRF